ncbi:hypothetical protein FKW77_001954 [Venturia effusa]|uniref:DSBA-like thioredoxin domain-containing protein n=1 Tax=Venturia effusa TaxID=50376 RepID=A0A517KZ54_9PEZI|nr:hypothetical protein FKW77_001954 [Venturia effusa]
MTQFDVTIVSDTSCPWCYIGYRRLQKAISLFQKTYPGGSKDTFNITWKPFYLKAGLDQEESVVMNGLSHSHVMVLRLLIETDRMLDRMGPEQIARAQKHMNSIGSAEGITFDWTGKTGKTKQSHQLLELAKTRGSEVQCKVAEELFRLHFEKQRDITHVQTIVDAGEAAGLGKAEVLKVLNDEEVGGLVDKEAQKARDDGISSVPQFSLQGGKYPVDGAQDAMDFFEVFMKIKGQESK